MIYCIKYIKSQEKRGERLARVFCVLTYLLCLAISEFYCGAELPDFFYYLHYN